jgi:hypothetical protein
LYPEGNVIILHILMLYSKQKMMKPWQIPVNKTPSQGGTKKKRTQVGATRTKPQMGHKGAREQIMLQSPHFRFSKVKVILFSGKAAIGHPYKL